MLQIKKNDKKHYKHPCIILTTIFFLCNKELAVQCWNSRFYYL